MAKELILIKLIQYLNDKGFKHFALEKEWWNNSENLKYAVNKKIYFPLIYSKEFGIFMWGMGPFAASSGAVYSEAWHYHFQQMVLMDEPLEYISQFLQH